MKKMGIKNKVFYVEFNWDFIIKVLCKYKIEVEEFNKFLGMCRDLVFVVDNLVKFSDIVVIVVKSGKKLIKDINFFDVYINED